MRQAKKLKISYLSQKQLANILSMIDKGTIRGKLQKIFSKKCSITGKDPDDIVKEKGSYTDIR